jgi:hypothetical protein
MRIKPVAGIVMYRNWVYIESFFHILYFQTVQIVPVITYDWASNYKEK